MTVFSLLIGLSQRKLHFIDHGDDKTFGTDRTFTFIGIFGYILYLLEPAGFSLFMIGGGILAGLFMVYYYYHLKHDRDYGLTTVVIGLITYCLGPLITLQPLWLAVVLLITVLIVSESKAFFISFSEKISKDEFFTLAKFLVIAGVILPLVPDTEIYPGFSLTPYKIWLAVVVISSISYAGYLLKKFVVKKHGILISGILGGLYSSTATTVILAKKSHREPGETNQYAAAIVFATGMMYLRVMALVLIFNINLFYSTWYWFLLLFTASLLVGLAILFFTNRHFGAVDKNQQEDKNPLEFRTALVFTLLFVALSVITHLVITHYGTLGLNLMSFLVGLVDVDPFLISLFVGKYDIAATGLAVATFQAIISNNLVKLGYGLFFGNKTLRKYLIVSFLAVIALNVILILII